MNERQQTILVLEDKFLIHHGFMIGILKDEWYAVSETDCGDDAVGLFIECYEGIDPALLDMQISDMNGAEALEQIQFIDAEVKAFFVSVVVVDWESLGALGILQKPFQAIDLARGVNDLIEN